MVINLRMPSGQVLKHITDPRNATSLAALLEPPEQSSDQPAVGEREDIRDHLPTFGKTRLQDALLRGSIGWGSLHENDSRPCLFLIFRNRTDSQGVESAPAKFGQGHTSADLHVPIP
jgi:hypothetical protein